MTRVAIVGHGLIGGSIALTLAERSPAVTVTTLDRGDDLGRVAGAGLVVLATPVAETIAILRALPAHVSPETLITDTGSTKAAIVEAAAGLRFIGGHPIAGSAASGRGAAQPGLFAGHPWILTPLADALPADLVRLRAFVSGLGGSVRLLDPGEHDRLFAEISHVPQLVVSALMEVIGSRAGAAGLALAGAGLRDTTRLASSPPGIWHDIVRTNHAHVAASLDALIAALTRLRDDRSGHELTAVFERAAAWKGTLDAEDRP